MLYYQNYNKIRHQYNTWPHRSPRADTLNLYRQPKESQVDLIDRRSQSYCPQNFLFLVYILAYCLFLLLGGIMFSWLEFNSELQKQQQAFSVKLHFLQKHSCVSNETLKQLLNDILETNNETGQSNWSLEKAVFFASTIITTIGYGHVTPLSQFGKIFCIAYAIVGIPLTLVLLQAFANRLLIPLRFILKIMLHNFERYCSHFTIRILHLILISILNLFICYLTPATIFSAVESTWTFLDSFYYCFISLTTIGFGDYVPNDSVSTPTNMITAIVYLYIGLICLIANVSVFHEIPELNIGRFLSHSNSDNLEDNKSQSHINNSNRRNTISTIFCTYYN